MPPVKPVLTPRVGMPGQGSAGVNVPLMPDLPPAPVVAPPDLIIPTGCIRMRTGVEMEASIGNTAADLVDVILPAGTLYEIPIAQVKRARWRSAELDPAGVWSFWAEVADEFLWLERDTVDGNWIINYNLPAPTDDSQGPQSPA